MAVHANDKGGIISYNNAQVNNKSAFLELELPPCVLPSTISTESFKWRND